jgi:hypothetical protein
VVAGPRSTLTGFGFVAPAYSNNVTTDGLDNNDDDRAARERFRFRMRAASCALVSTRRRARSLSRDDLLVNAKCARHGQ